uniref:Polyadenylate-binding protein n=1 Tax=Stereomyxa ramosa TaxID=1078864 RepID=A0A7S2EZ67_9EUKA|mmetsp:Transcript_779/g.975  ORF Transcript_779/g.975 Transcript_779/m.975 type:complete len:600 (+) Transcript_779:109-1908(+)|eukprot:CAMPEP_0174254626 /NCGR_PEP_ID=MMETSP0439-20130205/3952_1 /TAXON_ID=0 /ORGANISM="Stereomyxa ramosa, Strain Chinc5" /LENGTH=599 /DNA_ID=CAMNT_0015336333 /DNA_START=173 /DNA_END=1972 /DNA_ORIENTATION=-
MSTPPTSPYQSASLYVGDLHPTVTEALLFEIFKAAGPVASIRVCRDAVTRRSLGYAYVNYHNVTDAERALDSLNYYKIKGMSCRIMWSYRDPSIRKSGEGNIFIKNLDKSIDNKSLYDTFNTFGNILSCKVVTDEKGNSKGYGFIHYETKEAAEESAAKVNGMLLNGKIVYVGPFVPKKERMREGGKKKFTNVYVKNLDPEYTDEDLKKDFSAYGKVQSAIIMRDQNGKSRGFGFVNFEDPETAQEAAAKLNAQKIRGKTVYVGRAQSRGERDAILKQLREERAQKYQGRNLYVKNLDDGIDEDKLSEAFSVYGPITSCRIMVDEKGNSKGFGFVCFESTEDASKAVTEMNGSMLGGKPIYVALAESKEVRRSKLEAQHAARAVARMNMNPPNMAPAHTHIYPGSPFYPPQGQHPGGFVYPQVPVRGRWPAQGGSPGRQAGGNPYQQPIPNYIVPMAQRQGPRRLQAGVNQVQMGNNQGYKYTNNARNQQMNGPGGESVPGAAVDISAGMVNPSEQDALASMLQLATPEDRKNTIGERLYPLVEAIEPGHGPKITGMLLESMPTKELLHLLGSQEALRDKVQEALAVLKDYHEEAGGDV